MAAGYYEHREVPRAEAVRDEPQGMPIRTHEGYIASPEEMSPELTYMLPYERDLIIAELSDMAERWQEFARAKQDAMSQSSETWHDNAPELAVRNDAQILSARQSALQKCLDSAVVVPYPTDEVDFVTLGSRVAVSVDGRAVFVIDVVGVSVLGGRERPEDVEAASYEAPIVKPILGRKAGDMVRANLNGRVVDVSVVHVEQLALVDVEHSPNVVIDQPEAN